MRWAIHFKKPEIWSDYDVRIVHHELWRIV